jgi:hypothetical protein
MAKSGQKSARDGAGSQKPRRSRLARENARLAGLGFVSVVLSVIVSFQPLTPLLVTAPAVWPLRRRIITGRQESATRGLLRWAVAVFLSILVCAVFVKDRVLSSFPFGGAAAELTERLIAGDSVAPAGILYIVAGLAGFVALSAVSLGIGACLLASVAIGAAAGVTIVLYVHGTNLLLITLVAIPPWQWLMFAAAVLLFAPAADTGARLLYKKSTGTADGDRVKRQLYVAGALALLSVLVRAALADPWISLVRMWTVL